MNPPPKGMTVPAAGDMLEGREGGAMDKVRVGVVGVGSLGRHHARLYAELPDTELVGVADTDLARAREFAETLGVRAFGSFQELSKAGVDAVSVVVPTAAHHEVALAALGAGCHVLLEKPIARTLEEADEIREAARAAGRLLMVGHVERYNRAIDALRSLKSAPRFIEAHRLGPFSPRNLDTGVVLDLMIHDIDIVMELVESPVAAVEAVGVAVLSPTEDIANARLTFDSGCVANLTASRISPEKLRKIRVFQKDAYLSLDYLNQSGVMYRKVETAQAVPGTFSFGGVGIVREEMAIEPGETLRLELQDFLSAVRTGRPPRVTGEHGREALAVALRITEMIHSEKGMRKSNGC